MSLIITYNARGCSVNNIFIEIAYFVVSTKKWNKLKKQMKKYKDELNMEIVQEISKSPLVDTISFNPYKFFKSWTIHEMSILEHLQQTAFPYSDDGLKLLNKSINNIKNN